MIHRSDDPKVDEAARAEDGSSTESADREHGACRRTDVDEQERRRRVEATLQRIWALPVLDPTDPDEMLHDEDGLPK